MITAAEKISNWVSDSEVNASPAVRGMAGSTSPATTSCVVGSPLAVVRPGPFIDPLLRASESWQPRNKAEKDVLKKSPKRANGFRSDLYISRTKIWKSRRTPGSRNTHLRVQKCIFMYTPPQ